jgi:Skp family chaperone for outer membrane proteins
MKKIVFAFICLLNIPYTFTSDVNKSVAISPNLKLPDQGTKIGFVDPYKVLQGLEQWKDEGMKIQKELQAKNQQIEDKKAVYTTKLNALQGMGTTAKPEVISAKEYELKQLASEVKLMTDALQERAERVSQEAQMAVFKEIETISQEIALEMGLDLILAGGVLYVSPKLDVSAELIAKMNTKYASKKKQEQKSAPVMQPLPMKDLPK